MLFRALLLMEILPTIRGILSQPVLQTRVAHSLLGAR